MEEWGLPTGEIVLNLRNVRVITLYCLDSLNEVWFDNQGIHISLRNNFDVQLAELFIQKWLLYLNFKFTTIGFAAQGIGHYISFARGVMNIHVEIGYFLEPSLLAERSGWVNKYFRLWW